MLKSFAIAFVALLVTANAQADRLGSAHAECRDSEGNLLGDLSFGFKTLLMDEDGIVFKKVEKEIIIDGEAHKVSSYELVSVTNPEMARIKFECDELDGKITWNGASAR